MKEKGNRLRMVKKRKIIKKKIKKVNKNGKF